MRDQGEWTDVRLDVRLRSTPRNSGGRWLGNTSIGLAIANLVAVVIVLLLLALLWLWALSDRGNFGLAVLIVLLSNIFVLGCIILVAILTLAGGIVALIGICQEDDPNQPSGRMRCLIAVAMHPTVVVIAFIALVLVIVYYPYLRWALA